MLSGSVILTLCAATWAALRIGPSPLPDLTGFVDRIGIWRNEDLPPIFSHVRENLPYQLIYEGLGSRGILWYLAQWIATFVIAVGLLALWYADAAGTGRRHRGVRLALLSPVVAVFVGFIGGYDPLTVIGAVGMLWAWKFGSRPLLIAAGVFLGFQHFVQAVPMVIAAALTAWAFAQNRADFRRPTFAWALPGLVLGKVISMIVLLTVTGSIGGSRSEFLTEQWVRPAIISAINFWPIFLLSMFAGAWVIVAMCFVDAKTRARVALVAAFVVCLASCFFAADHTRIFILVALPSLALMTRWLLTRPRTSTRELTIVEVLAWVTTPVLLWTGSDGTGYVQYLGALDQLIMFGQVVGTWN
jgi:hypothetical protein